jgi:cold shock CspA family protein
MDGIVKFYCRERGFGFIAPLTGDPTQPEVFFHSRSVLRKPGQEDIALPLKTRVSFELAESADGRPHAINVQPCLVRLKPRGPNGTKL